MTEFVPVEPAIEALLPDVLDLRHDLHRHPELAFEEQRTATRVLEFIKDCPNLQIRTGIGGTGFAVTVGADRPGPCVALRADMDALPIEEAGSVEWCSTVPGKMHACGHDGHTAMLAGAVRILSGISDTLPGPVKCIFQPAEEGGGGAEKMCAEGVLEDPPVAAVFGLHNNLPDSAMKIGLIAYSPGAAMAGTGNFDIHVQGKGGHAAFPHKTIDPIYAGAAIINQLQGIVSRVIDPMIPAVISVTQFHAGTAYNIIPDSVLIRGTIRALDPAVLKLLRTCLTRRAEEVAVAHGAVATVECPLSYPVLENDQRAECAFREILRETGDEHNFVQTKPILGGEDFAFFGRHVPSFFYFLPSCPVNQDNQPHCHSPDFDFNDDLLATGIRLHVETGRRFANHWNG